MIDRFTFDEFGLQSIDCGCLSCIDEIIRARPWPDNLMYPFVVCDVCGNKRCPHATHHDNDCTGSNEPGQPGSIYGGIGL